MSAPNPKPCRRCKGTGTVRVPLYVGEGVPGAGQFARWDFIPCPQCNPTTTPNGDSK